MRMIAVLLLTVFVSLETLATTNTGTVITLNGDVWISPGKNKWHPMKPGQMITFGTDVKTGKGGIAGILNPDGSMFRISENSRVVYQPGLGKKEKRGFFAVLSDLFIERIRTRIGGARGKDEKGCPLNETWIELMLSKRLSSLEIERLFLVAGDYAQCGEISKTAALFQKLSETYHKNIGYKNLVNWCIDQASNEFAIQVKPKWAAFIKTGKGKQIIGKGKNTIQSGDRFKIHYHTQKSSYVYFFRISPLTAGIEQLFPNESAGVIFISGVPHFASFVPAGRKGMFYPKDWEKFDRNQKRQLLWSWSCFAPVSNRELDAAKKKLTNHYGIQGSDPDFGELLPSFCPAQWIQEYNTQ